MLLPKMVHICLYNILILTFEVRDNKGKLTAWEFEAMNL